MNGKVDMSTTDYQIYLDTVRGVNDWSAHWNVRHHLRQNRFWQKKKSNCNLLNIYFCEERTFYASTMLKSLLCCGLMIEYHKCYELWASKIIMMNENYVASRSFQLNSFTVFLLCLHRFHHIHFLISFPFFDMRRRYNNFVVLILSRFAS